MKQCQIIANSGAGSFSSTALDNACRMLAAAGIEPAVTRCASFEEMTAEAARLAAGKAGIIAAAGGDGTINAVFSGLHQKNASCAIIPLGTANVMAIELGISSAEDGASRIVTGTPRMINAGLVRHSNRESRFFMMAGAGFDGRVVKGVTLEAKKRLGKGAYVSSAINAMRTWESAELLVTADGRQFSCHSLIVTNISHYGGRFKLAQEASLFSPELYLLPFTGSSRSQYFLSAFKLASGISQGFTARSIKIESSKPLQIDGDYLCETPVEISSEPDYAEILI